MFMSYSSCIRHPGNSRYIQVHEWQILFCEGNHCAALLLAFFIGWHQWKLKHDEYYRKFNDIAEMHGDGRPHNEEAYLFFSMEQFVAGCLGFYGKKAINEALDLLESLNVLSIHKNPNKRYHFDKTKYFKFYPSICNQWIDENCLSNKKNQQHDMQLIDSIDQPKMANAFAEKELSSSENDRPAGEKARYRTNTTNKATNKNKSIQITQCDENFLETEKINEKTKKVVNALIEKGLAPEKFNYPDIIPAIEKLQLAGATAEMFITAYEIAAGATKGKHFGVNYIVKVVSSHLESMSKNKCLVAITEPISKDELKNARSWAVDIVGDWNG